MAIAISPEQRALQASIREWAKQADTLALVRGLEPGASPPRELVTEDVWHAAADLGIFSIALPAEAGGASGTTLCGPDGAASDGAAAAAVHEFLLSRCLSIAGGTSQIMLNVVAERALGLPREEVR